MRTDAFVFDQQNAERLKRQKWQLQRMRVIATSMLIAMLVVFVLSSIFENGHHWLSYVRAFSEAAMVGALADWFAVVALFRHPLGIPIPHTAIIPRNKDRIGENLGLFVEQNFLTHEIVMSRLRQVEIARKLAQWLAKGDNSRALAKRVAEVLPLLLDAVDDQKMEAFMRKMLDDRVRSLNIAALAGNLLGIMAANGRHLELMNRGLELTENFLMENRQLIRDKVGEVTGKYMPGVVDKYLAKRILNAVIELLWEIRDEPEHELRKKFEQTVHQFIKNLQESPEYQAKGQALIEEILGKPEISDYLAQLWPHLKASLAKQLTAPDNEAQEHIAQAVNQLGRKILTDKELLLRIDTWINSKLDELVMARRHEISQLIADTVKKWDIATISQKLEVQVGKDLQYIRINGTLVGGAAGVLIYIVSGWLHL